jgi:hypothetical protein
LGNTEGDREKIQKDFRRLYDFRCDIVHGNKPGKEMLKSHLATTGSFARNTLVWFLHYLHAAQPKTDEQYENVPSRDVLLSYLDLDKIPDSPSIGSWVCLRQNILFYVNE